MQNFYKTQSSTKNLMKGGGVIFFLLLNVFAMRAMVPPYDVFTDHSDYGIYNYNVTNLSPTLGSSAAPLNNTFETDPAMSTYLPIISLGGSGTSNQIAYTFSTSQPLADPNQGSSIIFNSIYFSRTPSSSSVSSFCSTLTKKPNFGAEILLYPNPASNLIFIEGAPALNMIQIYNLLGELVLEANGKQPIDVSNLPSGYYLLHSFDLNGKRWSKKFLKK